ncbi:hypothetical protein BIU87_05000 [Streptomyces sp. ZS0098]|nr:hypothetical protein BIU87_05000 [Streptomyces sp. ZS0098]
MATARRAVPLGDPVVRRALVLSPGCQLRAQSGPAYDTGLCMAQLILEARELPRALTEVSPVADHASVAG